MNSFTRWAFSLLLFLPFTSANSLDLPYRLVVCAIFQNETFYLKEWLEFHKLIGVEHFYLYNNLSTDNYKEILEPYLKAGEVDLFEWPVSTASQHEYLQQLQLPAYNHALNICRETAEWVAFIDLDEFLLPVVHENLPSLLTEYQEFAGLGINWQVYGTSHIEYLSPDQLLLEHLLWKAPPDAPINQTVKLIVQPGKVSSIENPHYFEYLPPFYAVDSDKNPLPANAVGKTVLIDRVRINHYWFGTLEFFNQQKVPRRRQWGFPMDPLSVAHLLSTCNEIYDDAMLRFTPLLKLRYPK